MELTTILTRNPSVGQHLEEVVTQAARQSVSQLIADEREVQRERRIRSFFSANSMKNSKFLASSKDFARFGGDSPTYLMGVIP